MFKRKKKEKWLSSTNYIKNYHACIIGFLYTWKVCQLTVSNNIIFQRFEANMQDGAIFIKTLCCRDNISTRRGQNKYTKRALKYP